MHNFRRLQAVFNCIVIIESKYGISAKQRKKTIKIKSFIHIQLYLCYNFSVEHKELAICNEVWT